MCSEFNQINGKLRVDNRNSKNYLGCRKCWWFRGQNNKETRQTGDKICINIYVSRIRPNPGMSRRQQH